MTGPVYRRRNSCEWTRRRAATYQEGGLAEWERLAVKRHLAECPVCAEEFPEMRALRGALQALPGHRPGADLNLRLRVIASREASRARQGRFALWVAAVRRWADELMRPIAIPTAGGFTAALLLFGMLAPTLAVRGVSASIADTPTGLYTEASVKSSLPLGYDGQDLLVEVSLDECGRMIEYSIPQAQRLHSSPELRRNIENHLLTMVFNPATTLGQPTSGKLRVWFRTSRIDVIG